MRSPAIELCGTHNGMIEVAVGCSSARGSGVAAGASAVTCNDVMVNSGPSLPCESGFVPLGRPVVVRLHVEAGFRKDSRAI